MESILEVKNLSVTLDKENILKNVSFEVKKGETLAIIGPNGAGKTVLFRALLGLVPHKGEINWQKDVRIGYVPQKFVLDRSIPLTVKEFFLLKSKNYWFPAKQFFQHLKQELNLVGLGYDILKKPVGELSGGQMQRILVAWAMLDHPDMLLFDEPTSGIDIGSEETVYNLMRRLQQERGVAILLISHEINVVYKYADKVICLNKKMICQGPPAEVLHPQELAQLYGGAGFYHHH